MRVFDNIIDAVHWSPEHIGLLRKCLLTLFQRQGRKHFIEQADEFSCILEATFLAVESLIVDEVVDAKGSRKWRPMTI